MGVPAFYRWLSEKYDKCVVDVVEDGAACVESVYEYSMVDIEAPNPNGIEFDNLYIDMNGIIHPCAHPENGDQPKTEEEMYINVMRYVDRLVAAIRPRRLLYLAIDGVAPRAKMNQQRSRRFRSAQEAEQRNEVEKEARDYMEAMGHKVPEKKESWDSNVITPGTKFMTRLAKYLRFYVRDRMNNVPGWKNLTVIISDASVPGEGEHKIMGYIRTQRSQEGYDPNQHHVLHGLDADLIMLGLATHESKFTISREEVLFGKKKHSKNEAKMVLDANGTTLRRSRDNFEGIGEQKDPGVKPLQMLHISTLREYLKIEFEELESSLPFAYQFERIIDDFVFLCFFVGNDFLPHLPCLDIREGAVDYLLIIYKRFLPSLGGYLTDAGNVNLSRVDVILSEVGRVENEIFRRRRHQEERAARRREQIKNQRQQGGKDRIAARAALDAAVAIKRRRTTKGSVNSDNAAAAEQLRKSLKGDNNSNASADAEPTSTPVISPSEEQEKYRSLTPEEAIKARVKEKEEEKLNKYREEVQDVVRLGEAGWKERYYSDKYKSEDIAHGGGREKVYKAYVEGLCWVMRYYYTGVASWKWFYPFHYAPFASDLVNIDRFQIEFGKGEPFCPFEQLMGVFPAASKHAIPKPYRWLMTDLESPIIDFYPKEIPVDPNGKPMPWLWVVLLPFIDEERLLAAMKPVEEKLSESEKKRNERYGKEIVFWHSSHPFASELPTKDNIIRTVNLIPSKTKSITGKVTYNDTYDFPFGTLVPAPKKHCNVLQDIRNNQVYSGVYQELESKPHICQLLDGVLEMDSILTEEDRQISIPRIGRGANIIDLAGGTTNQARYQNNYSSRSNYNGRGQQGNNFQPREYNQYLTDGYRGWGSLEPRQKQSRGNSNYDRGQNNYNYNHGGNTGGYRDNRRNDRGNKYNDGNSQRGSLHQKRLYGDSQSYNYQSNHGGYDRDYQRSSYGGSNRRGNPIQSDVYSYQRNSQHSGYHNSSSSNNQTNQGNAPPTLSSLRAGLMSMHQQRNQREHDYSSNQNYSNQRYDRRR